MCVCLRVVVLIALCVWSVFDVGCTLWMQCLVNVSLGSSVYGVALTLVVLCGCSVCFKVGLLVVCMEWSVFDIGGTLCLYFVYGVLPAQMSVHDVG